MVMSDFVKYQHIERFGTIEVEGICLGECFIFPKIDGTNSSVWCDVDNKYEISLFAGSRKRELAITDDNHGFYEWVLNQDNIRRFFVKNPSYILFGEWLVPHTLKTYEDTAWNKFYVFDVWKNGVYLPYNKYQSILDEFDIDYIPPIAIIKNPSNERLIGFLDKNTFLIKDGYGVGEGIVIKNYNYKNKFGRQTWAKIVKNDFKTKHNKNESTIIKEKKSIEEAIVNKYVTNILVEKEYSKIVSENNGWSSVFIPRLLNTIYYCLIKEESWNFIKDFKNPIIDYKRLNLMTILKIKEIKPELF